MQCFPCCTMSGSTAAKGFEMRLSCTYDKVIEHNVGNPNGYGHLGRKFSNNSSDHYLKTNLLF